MYEHCPDLAKCNNSVKQLEQWAFQGDSIEKWNIIFTSCQTYIKDKVLAVVRFEPAISRFQFLLPLWDCSLWNLDEDRIVQLNLLHLLLKLKWKWKRRNIYIWIRNLFYTTQNATSRHWNNLHIADRNLSNLEKCHLFSWLNLVTLVAI